MRSRRKNSWKWSVSNLFSFHSAGEMKIIMFNLISMTRLDFDVLIIWCRDNGHKLNIARFNPSASKATKIQCPHNSCHLFYLFVIDFHLMLSDSLLFRSVLCGLLLNSIYWRLFFSIKSQCSARLSFPKYLHRCLLFAIWSFCVFLLLLSKVLNGIYNWIENVFALKV